MVRRGGGVQTVRARVLDPSMAVVELVVNVCESMGANIVNTVCEHVAPKIAELLGGEQGICILSNLATERLTKASFKIPVSALAWKGKPGEEVAHRILQAHRFAELDMHRATTHNKGILNGIDAVALAVGQDWRAIEAGAHAFAAQSGRYRPLTRYHTTDGYLHGQLELPLAVGT